jgi:chromosome segregation ATPase
MQMMAPPEDALTERFARIDERFDEVNRRITEGREEAKQRFDRVEGDIRELKQSSTAIQATLTRISFGLALTFASVVGSILIKGL